MELAARAPGGCWRRAPAAPTAADTTAADGAAQHLCGERHRRARRRRGHDRRHGRTGTDERVRLIGIDTPETVKPNTPGRVLRAGGQRRTPRSCSRRARRCYLERDLVARDDYGRLLAYVFRADGVFVNRDLDRQRLRPAAGDRAEPRLPRVLRAGRRRRRGRRARPVVALPRIASPADDRRRLVTHPDAGRTPRPPRRAQARHHLLRRPRLLPRGQRRRLPALRDGAATCASIMVPAPWARHAADQVRGRPTTSASTSRSTASTTPTAGGRSPTPRRCCPATAGFPRDVDDLWEHADPEEVLRECRAQIERAIAWDIDVDPPRPAPHGDHAAPRVLRRLPRAGRRVPPADPPAVDDHRRPGRVPVPPAGRRGRRACSPTTSTTTGAPAAATGSTRAIADLEPGRHRDPRPAGDRHARGAGARRTHAEAWIDDLALVTDDERLPALLAEQRRELIGYRELRDAMRAG